MKGILLVNEGLEEYTITDIKEILYSDVKISDSKISGAKAHNAKTHDIKAHDIKKIDVAPGILMFDVKNYDMLCKYAYASHIASRVLLNIYYEKNIEAITKIISDCEIPNDIAAIISKDLKEMKNIVPKSRFRVSVINKSTDVIDSQSLEKTFGILISDIIKDVTVDLKNPEVIFYVIITDQSINLALDFSGDLSKRDYRIFNSPMSIKGTTAYGLLKIAEYKKGESLLDPYCNSGTIAIEAALYSNNISHKHYDKNQPFTRLKIFDEKKLEEFFKKQEKEMTSLKEITAADPLLKNVTAAQKNAKIAGVEKMIRFRRIDIDWMDIKHEEKHFDKIITFLPGSSKHASEKVLEKEFKELFYQAEYILEDDGVVAVLCMSKDLLIKASDEHFRLYKEQEFYSGEQLMSVLLFKKKIIKKAKN